MKLFEAGAVLLIIGSAVIGPIESHEPMYRDCIEMNFMALRAKPPQPVAPCERFKETIAQNCARAMKEIGARRDTVLTRTASGDRAWLPQGEWVLPRNAIYPPASFPYRNIVCIPAPTGLTGK